MTVSEYRLTKAAEADIIDVPAWSEETFGDAARRRYERLLITALRDVAAEPDRPGSVALLELGPDIRSWHLRNSRERARTAEGVVRRPRHFLLYRPLRPGLIGVGRVLNDAMDIGRHLTEL
jgi:toxin ParE1/3/4